MELTGAGLLGGLQGGSTTLDTTEAAAAAPTQTDYHIPPPSQVPAAGLGGGQQDTVTLSGASPAAANHSAARQFVPAAAFTLLAHEFTFPPENSAEGAGGPSASGSTSAAAGADQATASQQQPAPASAAQANATATAAAAATANAQVSTKGNSANSAASGTSIAAPQETLQQLDEELQRLGINPQDISLMNRMSLLLWVNDPAALRQFVAGMQPSASSPMASATADASKPQTSVSQVGTDSGASQSQGLSATALAPNAQTQNQSQNQIAAATQNPSPAWLRSANQNADGAAIGGAASDGASNISSVAAQHSPSAALQFQELQNSLVAASQQAQTTYSSSPNSPAPGQLLDISA